ncbi:MAG: radical SAM protein [Firmicutes bacterium]|nr:radical SAM protein [Bacillota bacterium]
MNLTLHITNKCNLACDYCFVPHGEISMTKEIAFKAIDIAMQGNKSTGILFYGGEPLLERQLIYDVVAHCDKVTKETGHKFSYKITTNGVLLDEEFLLFSNKINMAIGLSCDGPAQDVCRLFSNKNKTFDILKTKIPLLLKYHPYAVGLSVLHPTTVHQATDIAKFLIEQGFKYISMNVNYSPNAGWTKKHFEVLEKEYKKIAKMYEKWTNDEQKIYFAPFDAKILSHLKGEKYHADRAVMNREQPSIAPDGTIYSMSKYIDQRDFAIGDVFSGFDEIKRKHFEKAANIIPDSCKNCALNLRCNYMYSNLGFDGNNFYSDIFPTQCAHEQMLTPIADSLAQKLYKKRNALFIHKHYNDFYSVISKAEDGEI